MTAVAEADGARRGADRAADVQGKAVRGRASHAPRVLLYSHDTFGLGHFRRCLKIARHLNAVLSDSSILLLTGSPLAHRFSLPDGVDFVKLPAVVKTGPGEYASRSARLPIDEIIKLRAGIIRHAALQFQPDVFLVDHAPQGLRREVIPALTEMRRRQPGCTTILGLRDILDDPSVVVPLWESSGVYATLEELYDRIVIYGSPEVYDPTVAYRFPKAVADKTTFVGYITGSQPSRAGTRAPRRRENLPRILLTVGGGEDGQRIVETFAAMLRETGLGSETISTVLPGPLLASSEIDYLRRLTRGLSLRIRHFVEDVTPLMQRADLTISMGGYNAVSEMLRHAKRGLVIPRETPRQEQLMRAERLRDAGLLSMLRLAELNVPSLAASVRQELHRGTAPLATARSAKTIPLDGTARLTRVLQQALSVSGRGGKR